MQKVSEFLPVGCGFHRSFSFRLFFKSYTAAALFALLFAAVVLPTMAGAQTLKPENIYQKVLPSVMTLHVENVHGETFVGTAFLALDKNVAVTAWHVVCDASTVTAKFSDDRIVTVDGLIDKDEEHDLALIHLDSGAQPKVSLCFDRPLIGSRAYVIGAPKGFEFSITDGLVSQIQRIRGDLQYQVSCPISGGNSGGPVVNEFGEVEGVAAWTQKDAQNLSFAIPATFLNGLNPKHPLVHWSQSSESSAAEVSSSAVSLQTGERAGDIHDLKRLLKNSAGKHLTITVSNGDSQKKFDIVVPNNLVK